MTNNFIFLTLLAAFLYNTIMALIGRTPNTASAILFKAIPFFIAIACLVAMLLVSGVFVLGGQ